MSRMLTVAGILILPENKKMIGSKRLAFILIWVLVPCLTQIAHAQTDDATGKANRQIVAEVGAHNELMKNAEYLSDMLGPRLTGSENLRNANLWTAQKFKEYGLVNVHQESWFIGRSWTRGSASARIVSPAQHPIAIASEGWAAGTPGAVRGPVIFVRASKPQDLEAYKGKLRGAIVVTFAPRELEPPRGNPLLESDEGAAIGMNQQVPPGAFSLFGPIFNFVSREGAAAILVASDKKYELQNMFEIGFLAGLPETPPKATAENLGIAPTPTAYVGWEDYNLIWRLLKRGKVEIEINIQNSYSDKPVEVYNTVAEIRGSEKPDEVVMLGAHLDSWDLGTGATDNGTGVAVVLESARALMRSGVKPKRTIRFVLFTGEEQFLLGSKAYLAAHRAELSKISGILVHDSGTGRVVSINLQQDYAAREVMGQILGEMPDLGLLEPSLRSVLATDNFAFAAAGVPGFMTLQEPLDYNLTHHSQADTFDRVREDGLVQGAQVLSTWAYSIAQLPGLLPRQ